jgi:hypothetical protein
VKHTFTSIVCLQNVDVRPRVWHYPDFGHKGKSLNGRVSEQSCSYLHSEFALSSDFAGESWCVFSVYSLLREPARWRIKLRLGAGGCHGVHCVSAQG